MIFKKTKKAVKEFYRNNFIPSKRETIRKYELKELKT